MNKQTHWQTLALLQHFLQFSNCNGWWQCNFNVTNFTAIKRNAIFYQISIISVISYWSRFKARLSIHPQSARSIMEASKEI